MKTVDILTTRQYSSYGCVKCGSYEGHTFCHHTNFKSWTCFACGAFMLIGDEPVTMSGSLIIYHSEHPLKSKVKTFQDISKRGDILVTLMPIKVRDTSGCFIGGGSSKKRLSIVLKVKCAADMSRVLWMFEAGASQQENCITIGADENCESSLHYLSDAIDSCGSINTSTVYSARNCLTDLAM